MVLRGKPQAESYAGRPLLCDSGSAIVGRCKDTGREWDSADGLQFNRARFYDPAFCRWPSEDPLGFDAGDTNLYRYVRNNPLDETDPAGTDFIAVADRSVKGTLAAFYHYSLQYWVNCGAGPKEETDIGVWQTTNAGAKKEGSVELLAESGYKAWHYLDDQFTRGWRLVNVQVSVIHYDGDTGTRFISIYDSDPKSVFKKWDGGIIDEANKYPYAEQPADEEGKTIEWPAKHWPNSVYVIGPGSTNSNTFVRYVVAKAGLTMVELGGSDPGADSPEAQDPKRWRGPLMKA